MDTGERQVAIKDFIAEVACWMIEAQGILEDPPHSPRKFDLLMRSKSLRERGRVLLASERRR